MLAANNKEKYFSSSFSKHINNTKRKLYIETVID